MIWGICVLKFYKTWKIIRQMISLFIFCHFPPLTYDINYFIELQNNNNILNDNICAKISIIALALRNISISQKKIAKKLCIFFKLYIWECGIFDKKNIKKIEAHKYLRILFLTKIKKKLSMCEGDSNPVLPHPDARVLPLSCLALVKWATLIFYDCVV